MTRGDLQELAACNGLTEEEAIDAVLASIKAPLARMAFKDWKDKNQPMDWAEAEKYLVDLMGSYMAIGAAGFPGLTGFLMPLKARLEAGERTRELYDAIMACE